MDPRGVPPPPATRPSPAPRSRVDAAAEQAALACVRRGRHDEALRILMAAYGVAITAFARRVVRDHELVKDVRQQVFLEAFQGIDRFQGRSSFWAWLCGIAYHRCMDELRRGRRTTSVDDFEVLNGVVGPPHATMDVDRVAKQRALEQCLGKLSAALRSQLLMRYFFGLSYVEIGQAISAPHGTVQVRMSRILPRLRRCLRSEGIAR